VIEAFEERFGEGGQVQVLRIMGLGLFDRPAEMGAIEAVRGGEAIEGLTDELAGLTEGQLRDILDELRGYKLIAKKSEHNPNIVDCHPLVREHFGEKLRGGNPDGWREAHGRLYEYYKGVPEKELPDTLVEMEPLFAAVGHGCQAGRYQEALDDVYKKRIYRGNEKFILKKLGAYGADLAAVFCFFEKVWSRPVSELKESAQPLVLNWAGFSLRALGRLREAVEPMEASLRGIVDQKKWLPAGVQAGLLSELYLTLGDVKAAVDYGRRGVEYADKSGDKFQRMGARTQLANALHQAGAVGELRGLFEEAEGMQKERQAGYPLLYSVQGFYFCDLILSGGGYEEVEERARQTLEWAMVQKILLDIGLDKLSLGRAYLLEAVSNDGGGTRDDGRGTRDEGRWGEAMAKAGDCLGQAVNGLREAGTQHYIPRGLLGRAEYYRYAGEYEKAWVDLGEVREIAERGGMNLFLADYHLEAARVCLAEGECEGRIDKGKGRSEEGKRDKGKGKKTSGSLPTACRDSGKGRSGDWKNKARGHWEEAKERVEKMGYHRRGPEVLLIEAEVLGLSGKKEEGKKRLDTAKARIDEMGFHRWDSEVERISEINQRSK
jgi:tetratricopeptide (TPR) repeat protein